MKKLISLYFVLSVLTSTSFAQNAPTHSPELVVHLLDYLAKDYGGAVQGGKVISKFEYDEQVEFANIVLKNSEGVSALASNSEFINDIKALNSIILAKGEAAEVATKARNLQQRAIDLAKIDVSPKTVPNLEVGKKVYQASCVSCHGQTGLGDGPAGVGLDPKPANFHDGELVQNSSPYKFYNTIRLGVPGTGMIAFPGLTDQEVWAVAFYLKSLGYESKNEVAPASVTLKEAAILTDAEIVTKLGGSKDQSSLAVAALRTLGFPKQGGNPLDIAEQFLNQSVEAAKSGDYSKASEFSLRAYLEGIEPLEPKMKANLPGFVEKIETLMSQYRSLLDKREPIGKIESQKTEIIGSLKEVKKAFSENTMSPQVAFGAAFSIFLREGFEAVLIIIILISILRAMGQPHAIKYVHIGWASAVSLGIIAWFASGFLLNMSGLSRELLEGAISLLAVAVLVYVGFWLHRYSEMKKWRAFLESKLKHGLTTGSYFALTVVAFMAVFREAFEVVLFLRAIWMDLDNSGQTYATSGVLASLALLAVLSYFAIKESKKLPLKQLFQVCSWTMMALAVILVGKGLHSFQEAGFVGTSFINIPIRVDLLGIYPSIQTIGAQIVLIVLFAILLFRDKQQEH